MLLRAFVLSVASVGVISCGGGGESNPQAILPEPSGSSDTTLGTGEQVEVRFLDESNPPNIQLNDVFELPDSEPDVVLNEGDSQALDTFDLIYTDGTTISAISNGSGVNEVVVRDSEGGELLSILMATGNRLATASFSDGSKVEYFWSENTFTGALLTDITGSVYAFSYNNGTLTETSQSLLLGSTAPLMSDIDLHGKVSCPVADEIANLCDVTTLYGANATVACAVGSLLTLGGIKPAICGFIGVTTTILGAACVIARRHGFTTCDEPNEDPVDPVDPENPYNCSEDQNAIRLTVYQGRQLTFSDADIIAIHEHDSRVSYEYPFSVNYTYTGSEPDLISSVDDTITWQLHTKPGVSANHAWSLFGDLTAEHTDSFGGISGLIDASARGPGDLSISAIASSTVPFVEEEVSLSGTIELANPSDLSLPANCDSTRWIWRGTGGMSMSGGHNLASGNATAMGPGVIEITATPNQRN